MNIPYFMNTEEFYQQNIQDTKNQQWEEWSQNKGSTQSCTTLPKPPDKGKTQDFCGLPFCGLPFRHSHMIPCALLACKIPQLRKAHTESH